MKDKVSNALNTPNDNRGKEDYNLSILLIGPPGIGKTAWAKRYFKDPSIVEVRDLCSHLPEDLLGIPKVIDNKYVVWCPPDWLYRLSEEELGDKKAILVLDDIAAASPSVQVAVMSLVLERKVGSLKLGKNVKIILTANRRADKSGATTLPSALINRCETIDFLEDFPLRFGKSLFEDWCEWYFDQRYVVIGENGENEIKSFPLEIPSFLKFRPEFFITLPSDGDELGRFATPRSWTYVAQAMLEMGDRLDFGSSSKRDHLGNIFQLAVGYVGKSAAQEFASYMRHWGYFISLDIGKVIKDPSSFKHQNLLPTVKELDRLLALISAISYYIITNFKKYEQREITTKEIVNALDIISEKNREYFSWAFMLIISGLKKISDKLSGQFREEVVNLMLKQKEFSHLKDFYLSLSKVD